MEQKGKPAAGLEVPLAFAVEDGLQLSVLEPGGARTSVSALEGLKRLAQTPHVVCHAPYLIRRLSMIAEADRASQQAARSVAHYDAAELFSFACPAQFAVPTPQGLARTLGIHDKDSLSALHASVDELLRRFTLAHFPDRRETLELARFLDRANWPWAKPVLYALSHVEEESNANIFVTGLNVWDRIAEWSEEGPRMPGSQQGVTAEYALDILSRFLGEDAERRPQQAAYCAEATYAFAPRGSPQENNILLAEAGTGLGKTLAYLAPAHAWARLNGAPVWISTFTKNLQRQLEQETARIFPDPQERRQRIVIRKGRENYACLLNMQEAFGRLTARNARGSLLAALIARWARYSRDGDMIGGDFPAWIPSLLLEPADGMERSQGLMSLGLTDRRGECIYSACPHYRRCFIEKAVRAQRKADFVIANHALVLHQAAVEHVLGSPAAESDQRTNGHLRRVVFDEGHHLFDAADSAFSGHFTALEAAELRRWIRGAETRGRRGRSLEERLRDLLGDDEESETLLEYILKAALVLPGGGFLSRIQAGNAEGPAESFFARLRQQVLARSDSRGGQTLEADCRPLVEGIAEEADTVSAFLDDLRKPMLHLAARLLAKLDIEASELASAERARIEAMARSLRRRGDLLLGGWIAMLHRMADEPNPDFVDWFSIDQADGREFDAGLHSHWIDPTIPLAETVLKPADGVLITSATLKDRPPEFPEDWRNAEMRTGVVHLPYPVQRTSHDSPYDYEANSRIIVVNDVNREDMDQVSAAYRELFLAARGGALGLFTAISRLRAVYRRIIVPLAQGGLPLFAQHVDPLDTGTLVDMFRAEQHSCLLGTDAVRDGVDVPGDSLRLIVLDRVPWGQPTILERARRNQFGGGAYQDMIVRLRLRQAFGRLIRGSRDRGVFVVLDARLATRFTTAFPPAVPVQRMGLVEALEEVGEFLALRKAQAFSNKAAVARGERS